MKRWTWILLLCIVVITFFTILSHKENAQSQVERSEKETSRFLDPPRPETDSSLTNAGSVHGARDVIPGDGSVQTPQKSAHAAELTVRSEVRVQPVADIPASLAVVMGHGASAGSYLLRIEAVHGLGRNLSGAEIQALCSLLNSKNDEGELTADELHAVKNDVVNILKDQQVMPENLVHNLMAMYSDRGHDDVWRDYCLQHLGDLYESCAEKEQIAATLWDGTKEDQLSIAGTALIALANNIEGNYIKKEDVSEKALFLSSDPNCGELAKLTALQICAKLGERQVLPVARSLAREAQSVPLRISAIAAVGTLGNSSDREMLEKYAQSSDVRLRKSAESALERLNE